MTTRSTGVPMIVVTPQSNPGSFYRTQLETGGFSIHLASAPGANVTFAYVAI